MAARDAAFYDAGQTFKDATLSWRPALHKIGHGSGRSQKSKSVFSS
jgi:hypothetical protein